MLGRSMDLVFPAREAPPPADAPVVLSVRGLSRPPAFEDVSFEIRAGEIVGLAGLVGSGRTEIARAIFGADPATGTVEIEGRQLRRRSPGSGIRRGMALLPGEPQGAGPRDDAAGDRERHDRAPRRGHAVRASSRSAASAASSASVLTSVDARAASQSMPVSALSGGNQQKTAIAKWLVKTPKVLLADEPTRGIDVGAKRAIYELIHGLAAQGLGVLLISSELEEVLGLAHRVLVVRAGRIVAELDGETADEETVMRAAFGGASAA